MYLYMFDRVSFRCDSSVNKTDPEHLSGSRIRETSQIVHGFPSLVFWCARAAKSQDAYYLSLSGKCGSAEGLTPDYLNGYTIS